MWVVSTFNMLFPKCSHFQQRKIRGTHNMTSTIFFPLAIHLFSCYKTLVIFEKMVTLCNLSRRYFSGSEHVFDASINRGLWDIEIRVVQRNCSTAGVFRHRVKSWILTERLWLLRRVDPITVKLEISAAAYI